jgi:hypothetical protein
MLVGDLLKKPLSRVRAKWESYTTSVVQNFHQPRLNPLHHPPALLVWLSAAAARSLKWTPFFGQVFRGN